MIGGFYRVHAGRGNAENLNAPGMQFKPLAFAETCNNPDLCKESLTEGNDKQANRFYTYGVVGRLALLAAAREIIAIKQAQPHD